MQLVFWGSQMHNSRFNVGGLRRLAFLRAIPGVGTPITNINVTHYARVHSVILQTSIYSTGQPKEPADGNLELGGEAYSRRGSAPAKAAGVETPVRDGQAGSSAESRKAIWREETEELVHKREMVPKVKRRARDKSLASSRQRDAREGNPLPNVSTVRNQSANNPTQSRSWATRGATALLKLVAGSHAPDPIRGNNALPTRRRAKRARTGIPSTNRAPYLVTAPAMGPGLLYVCPAGRIQLL